MPGIEESLSEVIVLPDVHSFFYLFPLTTLARSLLNGHKSIILIHSNSFPHVI